LKDRYGLFWQIAPTVLGDMIKDSDRARAKRVAEAMLKMIKLDIMNNPGYGLHPLKGERKGTMGGVGVGQLAAGFRL
jgi:hypothetical protein